MVLKTNICVWPRHPARASWRSLIAQLLITPPLCVSPSLCLQRTGAGTQWRWSEEEHHHWERWFCLCLWPSVDRGERNMDRREAARPRHSAAVKVGALAQLEIFTNFCSLKATREEKLPSKWRKKKLFRAYFFRFSDRMIRLNASYGSKRPNEYKRQNQDEPSWRWMDLLVAGRLGKFQEPRVFILIIHFLKLKTAVYVSMRFRPSKIMIPWRWFKSLFFILFWGV